ncbi:MAG: DUF1080 domain-containing protein [Planctomycetales bacterium]|nr:DUF1080 domain-containing protein [Planctomycetales bacterium]
MAVLLCGVALPSLAEQQSPPPGFTALFNGTDLSGWYGWPTRDPQELWNMSPQEQAEYRRQSIEGGLLGKDGQPSNDHINAHWRVEQGELVNDGQGLYLTSDKDYGDFELHLEYKALPRGDSGIYLRGTPQVQLWDPTQPDPTGLGRALGSGGLWNNRPGSPGKNPSKKMDRPFGQWNSLQITMIGELVTVVFNGETVVDQAPLQNFFANQESGYLAWVKPTAQQEGAEQAKLPNGFMVDPVYAKGPIQLQTHGSEVRWRNIFIREISAEEANQTLAARDDQGFREWINGENLDDWQGAVDNYEIQAGTIVCKQGKGGTLLTKESYEDFILRCEFKLPPAGNNGIALRTPAGGHASRDGLEIQIIDSDGYNAKHPNAPLKPWQYHGSLYNCVGAKHGYLRPVGEWNFQEIEVRGQKIKVTLNGTKILDVDIDQFDRSQIEHPPQGLDHRQGYLGLAGHSDPVAFRSFRVKRL